MKEILVVGGGLAGLISAILLNRAGYNVEIIEKKKYPFHKVCGEYISNEVRPFLVENDLFPTDISVSDIDAFRLSSVHGKSAEIALGLGGFGISRYSLDHHLYKIAKKEGIKISEGISVLSVNYVSSKDFFEIELSNGEIWQSKVVVGAHGKRSKVDKQLNRSFIAKRSPYLGVKYHIRYKGHAANEVALHNFPGGYCGINRIEDGKYNLCYLSHRNNLTTHRQIEAMEKNVLMKNPWLRQIFEEAEFLFEKPEVINEISFETKGPVEGHILMCGDAAGMITPLCGNGMAMAIHSAKILFESIVQHFDEQNIRREVLENDYAHRWNSQFATRLSIGRNLQHLFGQRLISGLAVNLIKNVKPLARYLVAKTHGKPF
ncbi:MAG: NAD(P)/FAD-dependent oxidoreductase [Fulvivirga sp.]|nr:NAD(P)/FAD-dependent oxidoreductase [Fulvivirga sp.]